MSSVINGLYFLTLPLVSVLRVIYRKIRHARYLYIKRNVEKVWGARYTLGARYLSKNTVIFVTVFNKTRNLTSSLSKHSHHFRQNALPEGEFTWHKKKEHKKELALKNTPGKRKEICGK